MPTNLNNTAGIPLISR